ncbi:MAG: GAF and ANTAR domain-containing protein [Marmoricola sp.]
MTDDSSILDEIRELAALAVTEGDLTETAETIVGMAVQTVGADEGSLTVFRSRGRLETLAPTAPVVTEADHLQYELGEGPCVAAVWEEDSFVCHDLARDPRWPVWGPKAAALGLGALLATRLRIGERSLGALNLFSHWTREFNAEDRDHARVFATHATATLLSVQEREHLRIAVESRTTIGQAQGILMARYELDAGQAFSVLRRYSENANRKLRVVAEQVVSDGQLPPC